MKDPLVTARRLQEKHLERKREAFSWMQSNCPGLEEVLKDLKARDIPFELSLRDGERVIWN